MVNKKVVKKKVSKKENLQTEKNSKVENESLNKSSNSSKFKIKKSFLLIALAVLVLIAVLIYLLSSSDKSNSENQYEVYNGYVFSKHPQIENIWITTVNVNGNDQRFEFRYHPLDLEVYEYDSDINQYFRLTQTVNGNVSLALSKEVLDMQSGYVGLAGYDLGRILRTVHGLNIVVYAEDLEEYDWITCDNASINNMVVEFKEGESRIESSPFCVVLYFDEPEDSLKLSSLLIYNLLGIME